MNHIFEDDVAPLIPAGAVIIQKNWYDNTADNPNPDQWVNYGSRTADEMSHGWFPRAGKSRPNESWRL